MMRSADAFKILAKDHRSLAENTSWSPPTISRLFEVMDEAGRGTGKYAGYSTELHGKEQFFQLGDKALGHTEKGADDHRTFFNAESHKIGHETEEGVYRPIPRHVHVMEQAHHHPKHTDKHADRHTGHAAKTGHTR